MKQNWLKPFANHVLQEIRYTTTVAPLVVIPAHELEKTLVQFDTRSRIKDRGGLAMNEIAADNFVLSVVEDIFQICLAGPLHCSRDFLIARVLNGANR